MIFSQEVILSHTRNPDVNLPDQTVKLQIPQKKTKKKHLKVAVDVGVFMVVQATKIPLFQTDEDLHNLLGQLISINF